MLSVHRAAFSSDDEANLVRDLLHDSSARPFLSLLAFQDDQAVGHILFTRARLEPRAAQTLSILAPLAVVPEYQNQGIGSSLVEHGLSILADAGVDLVFVLGHPDYYPRFGFVPAGNLGFATPYPIPDKHADAWRVRVLHPESMIECRGTVMCADKLNKSEYWRE